MPTLASSSRVALAYIPEVNFGVTPGTGTVTGLRFTGESLSFDLSKETSKEIRADRQNSGTTTVDAQASGGINFELSYKEYDPFLSAGLGNTYTVYGTNGIGTTFTADFTATTITASVAPTGNSALTGLQKGQWFRMTTGGANNGKLFRVSPTVAPTATVITLDASTPAVVASTVATCAVQASRLTNGTAQPSFSIEKSFGDIAQFLNHRGMTVSKVGLKFSAGGITTGNIDFMGKDAVRGAVTALPGAATASQNYNIQNGVRGVTQLWENNAPIASTFVKSLDINIDNNLRFQTALGTLGAVGIGAGELKVTGSFEAYFADGIMYDRFLNDTYTSLACASQDTAGNGYVASLPYVMLTSAKVLAQGENQDIMAQFSYEAFADLSNGTAALQKTVFLDRVGA